VLAQWSSHASGQGLHKGGVGQGKITNMVMISQRPAEVKDRAVPGHWEGDLIFGKKMTSIGTLVERPSRSVILLKLPNGHGAEAVRKVMTKRILTLPAQLRRSITWDQGVEMSQHAQFTIDTGVQIYFCDPKSPWQRGSNENTTGLLRQYLERSSLSVHPTRARRRRPLTQYKASTDTRLDDTISGVRRGCCVDRLRPQPVGGTSGYTKVA
jgi:IS30 family transposase